MHHLPIKGFQRFDDHNLGSVGSVTWGKSVTTGAAATTKGTPVGLVASTLYDAYWLRIYAHRYNSTGAASDGAMDILIGAATEEIFIADLLFGQAGSFGAAGNAGKWWDFPVYIPAGSRLAVQAAGRRTSTAFRVGYQLLGGNTSPHSPVGTKVITYGNASASGTAVTAGTSGAEGSWTQITASTSEDHIAVVPSWQCGNDTTMTNQMCTIDIGVGSATEELISAPYHYSVDQNEAMSGPYSMFPTIVDIPASSRLVVRASTSAASNDTGNNACLHCVSA